MIPQTTPDIDVNRWGHIVTDNVGRTSKAGVYAGGDVVTGAATVIEAIGVGKRAAIAIHMYLIGEDSVWLLGRVIEITDIRQLRTRRITCS